LGARARGQITGGQCGGEAVAGLLKGKMHVVAMTPKIRLRKACAAGGGGGESRQRRQKSTREKAGARSDRTKNIASWSLGAEVLQGQLACVGIFNERTASRGKSCEFVESHCLVNALPG